MWPTLLCIIVQAKLGLSAWVRSRKRLPRRDEALAWARLVDGLPWEVMERALEWVADVDLAHLAATGRCWRSRCCGDDHWGPRFARLWRDKWNPGLGTRRWWLVDARRRGGETATVALPSAASASHVRLRRRLSYLESYRAAVLDKRRRRLYDVEVAELYKWTITFLRSKSTRTVAFHPDGCYEDGVFFVRRQSHCEWSLQRDCVVISTGSRHAVTRSKDWGWHVRNRYVNVRAVGSQPARCDCRVGEDPGVVVEESRGLYRVIIGPAAPRLEGNDIEYCGSTEAWVPAKKIQLPIGARVRLPEEEPEEDEDLRVAGFDSDRGEYVVRRYLDPTASGGRDPSRRRSLLSREQSERGSCLEPPYEEVRTEAVLPCL